MFRLVDRHYAAERDHQKTANEWKKSSVCPCIIPCWVFHKISISRDDPALDRRRKKRRKSLRQDKVTIEMSFIEKKKTVAVHPFSVKQKDFIHSTFRNIDNWCWRSLERCLDLFLPRQTCLTIWRSVGWKLTVSVVEQQGNRSATNHGRDLLTNWKMYVERYRS